MKLKKLVNNICCKFLFKVEFVGLEDIDFSKSYVFVANHVCSMDALFIWSKIKKLCIMAKEELFKFKPFGKILKSQGVFPIARGKKDFGHVYHAVNIVRSKDNNSLLIFPEGTRKAKQKGVRAKNGATYIAATTGVQVVPIHITEKIKLFGKVKVVFGTPITLDIAKEDIKNKKLLTENTEKIMNAIYSLGD